MRVVPECACRVEDSVKRTVSEQGRVGLIKNAVLLDVLNSTRAELLHWIKESAAVSAGTAMQVLCSGSEN